MKPVFGGALLAAAVAAAMPVSAQSPMTPVRPLTSPGAARQYVEPPPAQKPAVPPSTAAADAAVSEAAPPAAEAEQTRRPPRRCGGASTASRLNRQELSRQRYGTPSYYPGYYYGYGYGYGHGYGPSPYSSQGD